MNLSDSTLRHRGPSMVMPWNPDRVQPASIDLTLGDTIKVLRARDSGSAVMPYDIDPADPKTFPTTKDIALLDDGYRLPRLVLVLGATREQINVPDDLVGRVEGKSSLARLGLLIHMTGGFIDPGFCGTITLEILNAGPAPIVLRRGMAICQIAFQRLDKPVEHPYGDVTLNSKYMGQIDPTPSRYEG